MNRDRIIGIITIVAAVLFVAYVALAMWLNEKRARDTVLVQFHEMGALQNEDVVLIRGFRVGNVASVKRVNEKALVEIDLDEPRVFRKDTRFRNVSPNIMGSRFIVIEPGKDGELAPEGHVFDGEFEMGVAEVLALSDLATEKVAVLMDFIRLLQTGDEENSPLQKKIEDIMQECEDLVDALTSVVSSIEKQTLGLLDRTSGYVDQITKASVQIDKTLDTLRVQAQDGIIAAESIILKVNSTIESLNEILVQFENSPVTVALMDKKDIINDLDSLRSALDAFIGAIDRRGVKIYDEKGKRRSMVSLKNIHIFRETARSKAKKRALQEEKEKGKE
ncbi:MAG: MlaD family protein [Fibromonadaceae bacterium]|jgi:ABC-type transporter Mla subunit MlaD|nr:MlaD family protein [Fibromonadaceae bacterium]